MLDSLVKEPSLLLESIKKQNNPIFKNLEYIYTIKLINCLLEQKKLLEAKKHIEDLIGISSEGNSVQKYIPIEVFDLIILKLF